MKYGFLFGAGAEVSYGLPSGGKFALDIFRFDTSSSKKAFKDMRDGVDPTTDYASYWLPTGFMEKNISIFSIIQLLTLPGFNGCSDTTVHGYNFFSYVTVNNLY